MKIKKYGSATVLIETQDVSILCDPWLTDGIYYGSWCNYPPINLKECDLSNVDFVYISHIHPDHFDPLTMELIDKSVPILIHKYHHTFLKAKIERLGFTVIEMKNGLPFDLSETTKISIFAADDCDPSICGHMFGSITSEIKGSLQLDSLCVVDDGKHILVNTNDCPYGITEKTLVRIKTLYPKIDFALVGYTVASLYPHSMMDYSDEQMESGIEKAKSIGLLSGLNTLKVLQPKYYMPFAGTYILGGDNYKKNKNLPLTELQDAVSFFQSESNKILINGSPVLLNFGESFDLENKISTSPYLPIDKQKREEYIENVASKFKYTYENEETPSEDELLDLFNRSLEKLKRKQNEIEFFEDLNIVFDISKEKLVCINLMKTDLTIINNIEHLDNYHRFQLDIRLLRMVLLGPRFASWDNIEIGALLNFARKPDVYRMDVHILINFLCL